MGRVASALRSGPRRGACRTWSSADRFNSSSQAGVSRRVAINPAALPHFSVEEGDGKRDRRDHQTCERADDEDVVESEGQHLYPHTTQHTRHCAMRLKASTCRHSGPRLGRGRSHGAADAAGRRCRRLPLYGTHALRQVVRRRGTAADDGRRRHGHRRQRGLLRVRDFGIRGRLFGTAGEGGPELASRRRGARS